MKILLTNRILIIIILHAEDLSSIEIVHVVDSEHETALVKVEEFIIINENILRPEIWIAHRLRMDVQERPSLHVQIGTRVKCVVTQDKVIKRRKE